MLAEPRQIGRIDDLRVLDPPAPIALVGRRELVDGVQHHRIGAVADRVNRDLEVVDTRAAHEVAELGLVHAQQPGVGGIVRVRRFQRGAARAEGAVEEQLETVEPEPVVIKPRGRSRAADQGHRVDPERIGDDPDAQRAQIPGAAIGLPVLDRSAHVADGGEAMFDKVLLRPGEGDIAVFGARRGHLAADQCGGIVDEHAGRLAIGGAFDPSARRGLGRGGDAGRGKRGGVAPAGMIVDAFEPDRAVGDHRVEFGGGRKPPEPPGFLVPAASQDPWPVGIVARISCDLLQRFGERTGVRKVEREQTETDCHDVGMRVDQPRHQHFAFGIDEIVGLLRPFVAAFEHIGDAALGIDYEPGESLYRALVVEGNAGHVVDQRVGMDRRREPEQRGDQARSHECARAVHFSPRFGRRRMSALVS